MLSLKAGVKLRSLQPQMVLCAVVVGDIFSRYGVPCIITSGSEGEHRRNSLHYSGNALDFRTRQLTDTQAENIFNDIKRALGGEYDVVLEATHLHVEYQPERE